MFLCDSYFNATLFDDYFIETQGTILAHSPHSSFFIKYRIKFSINNTQSYTQGHILSKFNFPREEESKVF